MLLLDYALNVNFKLLLILVPWATSVKFAIQIVSHFLELNKVSMSPDTYVP